MLFFHSLCNLVDGTYNCLNTSPPDVGTLSAAPQLFAILQGNLDVGHSVGVGACTNAVLVEGTDGKLRHGSGG